jgi:MoxR-like ATPase
MSFPYFAGDGTRRDETVTLPRSRRIDFLRPEYYRADPGLVDAVNVALLLGQPLLLTGEPGTGKTQLAYYLAWELGLGDVLKYETKSNSTAGSIFYTYDALKRFQHAHSNITNDSALPYITYNALGKAILLTRDPADVTRYLSTEFVHPGKKRSVVVIDEIDKAPRDFPNDILNELDQLYFRVPELDNEPIAADPDYRPVIVMTSNSEKDLPDAFLRRCIFYHIPFPGLPEMKQLVANRLGLYASGSNVFLADALELFYELRKDSAGLRKKPATAELLDWLATMIDASKSEGNPFQKAPGIALQTISCLAKTKDDQDKAATIVGQWVSRRT